MVRVSTQRTTCSTGSTQVERLFARAGGVKRAYTRRGSGRSAFNANALPTPEVSPMGKVARAEYLSGSTG